MSLLARSAHVNGGRGDPPDDAGAVRADTKTVTAVHMATRPTRAFTVVHL